jgi:hypothetical protein
MRGRLALVGLLLLGAGFTCGPVPAALPADDICGTPVIPAAPFTLEIGGMDPVFQPWQDGATVPTILGGQGSDMIVVRARLLGADVPECIRLTVRVTIREFSAGMRSNAVLTYTDGGGRATRPMYVVLFNNAPGDTATVAATVGEVTITRQVILEAP